MTPARKKWRPSIAMVVAVVCISLMSIPLLALLAVRLTSNQFVRETEQSLIHQAAIYARVYAQAFAAQDGPMIGTPLSEAQRNKWNARLHPFRAGLNVHRDTVGPERPDGKPVSKPLDPRHVAITKELVLLARQSQRTTLSGIVFLDHEGRALNTSGAPSHAGLAEVQTVLNGDIGAQLRARGDDYEPHPLASLSRDTGYRVFVTYPVIADDRVIGAIYLSRTPLNLGKFLYRERDALMIMLVSTLFGAALIGYLLIRLISRPIYALRDGSQRVVQGQSDALEPVPHYGLQELAALGDSLSRMTKTLSRRSREIATYTDHVTHELKSPVTSIIGAAELLQDGTVGEVNRTKLTQNIEAEALRMNRLLGQLRDMTRLRSDDTGTAGNLVAMLPEIDGLCCVVVQSPSPMVPLSVAHGQMILHHMGQNAIGHGATQLRVSFDDYVLRIADDGHGIAAENMARVTETFFTTRRAEGGTGMGLAIVQAVLENYDATLVCLPSTDGAVFEIRFTAES